MPMVTACNINGTESGSLPRVKQWKFDGRLNREDQIGDEVYAEKQKLWIAATWYGEKIQTGERSGGQACECGHIPFHECLPTNRRRESGHLVGFRKLHSRPCSGRRYESERIYRAVPDRTTSHTRACSYRNRSGRSLRFFSKMADLRQRLTR